MQVGVDISMDVLRNPDAPPPNFPYAAMLHECVHEVWTILRTLANGFTASGDGSGLLRAQAHAIGEYVSMVVRRLPVEADVSLRYSFFRAVESWMNSQVEQARNRSTDEIPSVEDFIILRRRTIGGPIVEGMQLNHSLFSL